MHQATPAPQPTTVLPLAAGLGLCLSLGVATPAPATPMQHMIAAGDAVVTIRLTRPDGWQPGVIFPNLFRMLSPEGGRQVFWIGTGRRVTGFLEDDDFAPLVLDDVQSWEGEIAGHPARFLLTVPRRGIVVEGLGRPHLQGNVIVALLDDCAGPDAIPIAVTYASGESFGAHDLPADYLALTEGLTLDLPADMRPCAVDLTEPMELVAPPAP